MGDMYKNVMNSIPHKDNIILVIPSAYSKEEFSDDFYLKFSEDLSKKNKLFRLYYIPIFCKKIKSSIGNALISRIYFQHDQFMYNYFFCLFFSNAKITVWLHDPILHDGVRIIEKIYRRLSYFTYFHKVSNFIVSYNNIPKIKILDKIRSRFIILYLPTMPELEFPDIRDEKIPIKWDYMFFGRIEKYKGINFLIKVFSRPYFKGKRLLIVGRGKEDSHIQDLIKYKRNITFVNHYVSNRELAKYIKKSRCIVLPYTSATGSQTIWTANYYGRMVIASAVGCFPEYIDDNVNGLLFPPLNGDKLEEKLRAVDRMQIEKTQYDFLSNYKKNAVEITAKNLYDIINDK